MPEIIQTPSIWDYISGAATKGITSYQDAKDKVDAEAARNAGLTTQLFNSGAVDSTDLMPALAKIGIKTKVNPNDKEMQRIYSKTGVNPVTGLPFTEAEKARHGIQTKSEELGMNNELAKAQATSRFGKPDFSEADAALSGLPTTETLSLGRLQKQDAVLGKVGDRYVDMALAPYSGRVPKDFNKVIDQAYAAYTADRQKSGMTVDPSHRAYFVSQIFDRYAKQRELDISEQHARAAMASATRPQMLQSDKEFMMLTGAVESRRKALDDFVSTAKLDPMLGPKLGSAHYQNDPAVVEFRKRAAKLQSNVDNAMNAQAQTSGIHLSDSQRKLLSVGEAALEEAKANPGVSAVRPNVVQMGVQIAKQNRQTAAQIDAQVLSGRISRAEAEQIKKLTGAK